MKHYIFSVLAASLLLASCNSAAKFKIEGAIASAENEILYFENVGLLHTVVLDSVKLKSNGNFVFKQKRPEYPDFYRLRIGRKTIDLAIDSCETVTVTADAKTPVCDYAVENSPASEQIRRLRCSVIELQKKANAISASMPDYSAKLDTLRRDIETHKTMARRIILENPRSLAAYYAIYQTISGAYIFSPYVKEDKAYCAAVATSFDTYMPKYIRSQNLYSLVMDAINTERQTKSAEQWREAVANNSVGYFDIELPDRNDVPRKLSIYEGKVILLDFSVYQMENSVDYIFELRALYNKYHGKGFEIYQVSLDSNKLLWQDATENISWAAVRDADGAKSRYAQAYNVQNLPTIYIINKKGEIVARENNFQKLDRLIAENLK